jgi:hypothetical protein
MIYITFLARHMLVGLQHHVFEIFPLTKVTRMWLRYKTCREA